MKYFSNSSLLHKAHPHGNFTFKLFFKSIVFKQYMHTNILYIDIQYNFNGKLENICLNKVCDNLLNVS